jgi:hypothetical protein
MLIVTRALEMNKYPLLKGAKSDIIGGFMNQSESVHARTI